MGHIETLSQEKYSDYLFNHITKQTNNHKKKPLFQIWIMNHCFIFIVEVFRRKRFYHKSNTFEQVVPFILFKAKVKLIVDFNDR